MSKSSLGLLFLAVALSGAACKSDDKRGDGESAVDQANSAAEAARGANQDLAKSRTDLAQESAKGAVAIGDDVASKARTDALFVDQRNTVLSDGRNTIRTIDEQIADLKAHGSTATSPAQLQAALDAAGAARTVASTQVEQLATATPETWDVQRKAVEDALAALKTTYTTAAEAR